MNNLGIILAPYGKIPGAYPSAINYSYGGGGQYLCPEDPFFNTRGEQGFYYDTYLGAPASRLSFWQRRQLKKFYKNLTKQRMQDEASSPFLGGAIPTDAELATYLQYTPVESGWVAAKEGYFPAPWLPPDGWNQAGGRGWTTPGYGPHPELRGLGETPPPEDVIAALNVHNQRVFALTLVSTAAVAIAAMLGAYRTIRLLREK